MKKLITIIIGLLVVVASYGQTKVNKRIMLDSLNNKLAIRDTSAMLSNYALTSEVGEGGGTTIGDVRDEIADSLNVLRPLKVNVADTATVLTNYALFSEVHADINDSIDARMGAGIELSDVAVMIADSTGNAAGNYVTRKALIDSIAAAGGGVAIGDVRDEIADSLNVLRPLTVIVADSTGNAPGNYVTHKALSDSLDAIGGGLTIGDVRDEVTVTAEDEETEQEWTVTVTVAEGEEPPATSSVITTEGKLILHNSIWIKIEN